MMVNRDHIDKIIDHIRDYAADCDLMENDAADNIRTHVDALTHDLRGLGIDIDKRSFRLGMIFAWELSDSDREPPRCKYYSECGISGAETCKYGGDYCGLWREKEANLI